jgi:PAS domain S-box-containing protein
MTEKFSGLDQPATARRRARLFGGLTCGLAFVVLAGWITGWRFLAGQWGGYLPMAPSTALACLCLGGGLFSFAHWPGGRVSRGLIGFVSLLVFFLGFLVLVQSFTGFDFGLEFVLSQTNERLGLIPVGRMSPVTAGAFLLESAAFLGLLTARRWRPAFVVSFLLAGSALVINVVILTGYAYGVPLLYGGGLIPTALPTAAAFVLLGLGQIDLAWPGIPALRGWGRTSIRGLLIRAFLPPLLGLIFILGWVETVFVSGFSLNPAVWHSLLALVAAGLLALMASWLAFRIGDPLEQVQASLRKSEERYRAVAQTANDAILLMDSAGQIIDWNHRAENLFGYTQAEASGQTLTRFMPARYQDWRLAGMARMQTGGEKRLIGESFEVAGLRKDGHEFPVELSLSEWETGGERYYTAILRDITARKQAEEALAAKNHLLQSVFESAPYIMLLVDLDGRVIDINHTGVQFSGREKADLLGLLGGEVFGCLNSFHGPGCGKQAVCQSCPVRSRVTHTFETGEPIYEGGGHLEVKTETGNLRLELLVSTSLVQMVETDRQVLVTIADITERKRMEAALLESEKRWRSYIEHAPLGVFVTDENGKYLEVNPAACRITGYPADELVGMSILDLLPPAEHAAAAQHFQQVVTTGEASGELVFLHKTGQLRHWSVDAVRLSPTRLMGFAQDITERKLGEEALRESELNYKTLADSGRVLIWTSGEDKLCNYFNQPWLKFTGRTFAEEAGNGWAEGVHPDDFQRCLEIYTGSFDRRESFSMEYRLRRADGAYRWLIDDGCPRYNHAGEFLGYLGYCFDITERKQAEAALQLRESYLFAIIENLPGLLWLKDSAGKFLAVNTKFSKSAGLENPEALVGRTDLDIWPQEMADKYRADDARVIASGKPVLTEEPISDQGVLKWFETFKTPIFDQQGAVIGTTGYSRDITERKQAEAALRASEERYTLTLAAVKDGLWDWNVPNGEAFFSELYYALLGYENREFPATYATWRTLIHAEDLERVETELRKSIQSGAGFIIDLRMKMKSGEWRWVSTRGRTVETGADGSALRMVGTLTDITERKQAEEALRASELRFRALFEQAAVGVGQIDSLTGRFIRLNQKYCDIVGYSPAEMEQMDFQTITHPEDLSIDLVNMERLRAGELREFTIEKRYFRKSGELVWISLTVSAMWAVGAPPDYHIAIVQDITERKQAETALRASLVEKETLIKEVHHRVKNNLASINGLIHLQQDLLTDPVIMAELSELSGRIHSMALVHELLYQSETLSRIDLKDYFGMLTAHLSDAYDPENRVHLQIAASGVAMDLDHAIPCGLIVNELVTNAFKYAFPERKPLSGQSACEIFIAMAWENGVYTLTVSDNGQGFPAGFDWKTSKSLGLQLVMLLSQRQLKGRVELEAVSGTLFRLRFAPRRVDGK